MVLSELEKELLALKKKVAKLEKQNKNLNERIMVIESSYKSYDEIPNSPQARLDLWAGSQR